VGGYGSAFHKAGAKDAKNYENSQRLTLSFKQKMWKKMAK
jgi:hypothetical protein